eukprot:1086604-Prorocentrum_minimum.AAC.2
MGVVSKNPDGPRWSSRPCLPLLAGSTTTATEKQGLVRHICSNRCQSGDKKRAHWKTLLYIKLHVYDTVRKQLRETHNGVQSAASDALDFDNFGVGFLHNLLDLSLSSHDSVQTPVGGNLGSLGYPTSSLLSDQLADSLRNFRKFFWNWLSGANNQRGQVCEVRYRFAEEPDSQKKRRPCCP